jgi:Ca2+-binding RTX toxin-like protein
MAVIYGTTGPDTKNGTAQNDTMYGWAQGGDANSLSGNDTLNGLACNDNLSGGTENDSLIGSQGEDTLNGQAGNDTLDGGSSSDILNGGAGNDLYIIDSTGDKVTKADASGTDTVRSFVSYTLGSNLENLTLQGTGALNGTGNSVNNTIIGNAANNTLNGEAGDDTLNGGLGTDDTLNGGTGNDTYIINGTFDTAGNLVTSLITEAANSGIDTVQLTIQDVPQDPENIENYTVFYYLDSDLENLRLETAATSSTVPIVAYGNALDNILSGGAGNNYVPVPGDLIYGLEGGDGNDKLYGQAGDDGLNGGLGNDTLEGGYGNDTLNGDDGNDYVRGGNGNDNLYGGNNNDTLTGGTGVDSFSFNSSNEGIDTLTDFVIIDDTITVNANAFGGGLTVDAAIMPNQFVIGSAAVDDSNRFIYNRNTGGLFFDVDGTGLLPQVQLASLSRGLAMTNADIFVTS